MRSNFVGQDSSMDNDVMTCMFLPKIAARFSFFVQWRESECWKPPHILLLLRGRGRVELEKTVVDVGFLPVVSVRCWCSHPSWEFMLWNVDDLMCVGLVHVVDWIFYFSELQCVL